MSKFIERRTRPTIDLEAWDDGRKPTRAVAAAAFLLGGADTTDATCYGWVPQAHAALGAALDVEEMARAAYEHGRSTSPASTRKRMQPWDELTESAREPCLARVAAIRTAILGEIRQHDPMPTRCDQQIAMQGYDAVPCERDAGHRGIHWSNTELTATAPEVAQDGRTPVRRAPGGGNSSQGADGASARTLGDPTAGDILNLVHTVRTRGGVGEVAGVRIERVEDGVTPTMRRLEAGRAHFERGARAEHAANARLAGELERLHTWAGLLELLDEHWPEDIYPTLTDDPARNTGPRLVSALRRVDQAEAARDKAITERDEVLAVLDGGPVRPCCSRGPGGIHTCGGWEGGDRG